MKNKFSKDESIKVLKEFFPIINPLFLPLKISQSSKNNLLSKKEKISDEVDDMLNLDLSNENSSNENKYSNKSINENEEILNNESNKETQIKNNFLNKKRKKFDAIYDNLLMIGLLFHGKKNIDLIQQIWVNSRSPQEIRHRIKNLTCKRAPENVIKKWKNLSETSMNKEEFKNLIKGIQWFGVKKKWNVISRYFLPERSPDYLENVYETLLNLNILTKNDNSNINISEIDIANHSNKKKKNLQKEFTNFEKNVYEISQDFDYDLIKLSEEIKNIETKNYFYSDEQPFEKFEIEDNLVINKENNKGNFVSTRSRNNNNSVEFYNMFHNNRMNHIRGKMPIFDFHIKKSDDSAYEKIIID